MRFAVFAVAAAFSGCKDKPAQKQAPAESPTATAAPRPHPLAISGDMPATGLGPKLVVADEPVSMLDMSVRAKILELMLGLKRDFGFTYLYITHDLATAKFFCDRVAIMYLGRVVEIGPTEEIFADPKHPYTKALLKAIPDPDPDRMVPRDLPRGEIPDAARPPLGCSFHPRCPEAVAECGWESRDLRALLEEHWIRQDPSVYEEESELVGDLDRLDEDLLHRARLEEEAPDPIPAPPPPPPPPAARPARSRFRRR